MAYYSTRLDPVAQAMSECLQAVVAAGLCSYCTKQTLTLKVPHAYFYFLFFLLTQPHINIERCVTFNPVTLLLTAENR